MNFYTHNGRFHADEITAWAIFKQVFSRAVLHRVSELPEKKDDDVFVDISRKYDPDNGYFDHHQGKLFRVSKGQGFPLASAGMIWAYYGKLFIQSVLGNVSPADKHFIWERVDRLFITGIDLNDVESTYYHEGHSKYGP